METGPLVRLRSMTKLALATAGRRPTGEDPEPSISPASHFRLVIKSVGPDQIGLKPQTSLTTPTAISFLPPNKGNMNEK